MSGSNIGINAIKFIVEFVVFVVAAATVAGLFEGRSVNCEIVDNNFFHASMCM